MIILLRSSIMIFKEIDMNNIMLEKATKIKLKLPAYVLDKLIHTPVIIFKYNLKRSSIFFPVY
jgi:hypothetical protein